VCSALPLVALSCGGKKADQDPETARRREELQQISAMYEAYAKAHEGEPPKQLSDLATREHEQIYPLGFRVLREGSYVVVWGASGKDSGTVLAYEKDAPAKGGFVLTADGNVQKLTADELNSKLK
jgi:hypothetical protein